MTIATEKLKGSVARSTFVRLTPRRYINSDSYTSLGGQTYQFTFNSPIAYVYSGSQLLTRVTTVSNDYEYSHDEDDGTLIIKTSSGLEAPLIVSFYLFYNSSSEDSIAYETPTDSTTTARNWQARISTAPIVNTSFRNILDGVATVTSSAIQLVNTDNAFQAYLTNEDSFSKAAAEIWIKYGDSFRKIYTGLVSGVTIDRKSVSLAVDESTSALLEPAYMGDTVDEAVITLNGFADAYTPDVGKPIPFIFGKSRHGKDTILNSGGTSASTKNQHIRELGGASISYLPNDQLNPDQCTKAVCISYSTTVDGISNRTWQLCRVGASGFKTLSLGNPTGSVISVKANTIGNNLSDERFQLLPVDDTNGQTEQLCWRMEYPSTVDGNLEVGDSFVQISTGWHYMVTYVGSNYVYGRIEDSGAPNNIDYNSGADTYATSDFTMNQAPAIAIYDNNSNAVYYPFYGSDFTYTIDTTSGGNYTMSITFENNFEDDTSTSGFTPFGQKNHHPNMTYIHPTTHTVAFRATQATTSNATRHDNCLKALVEGSGLTADTTTFSAAGSALSATCQFQIPAEGESEIGSYLNYIQMIAKSAFGYVSPKTDGSIKYTLFSTPAAGDIYTDNEILVGSMSASISYQDIATSIQPNNSHIVNKAAADSDSTIASIEDLLHDLSHVEVFEHVLTDISSRISTIMQFKSKRRGTYSFSTATYAIESLPGDDITLESDMILGGEDTSRNLKIVSMSISESQIDIEACDFLGVGWGTT